jgi:hypothetical protein
LDFGIRVVVAMSRTPCTEWIDDEGPGRRVACNIIGKRQGFRVALSKNIQ